MKFLGMLGLIYSICAGGHEALAGEHPVSGDDYFFGTPAGTPDTPEKVWTLKKWGLNASYAMALSKTDVEKQRKAIAFGHKHGLEFLPWVRGATIQMMSDAGFDGYWYNEPGFGWGRLAGYHSGGYPGYTKGIKEAFLKYLKNRFPPEYLSKELGIKDEAKFVLPRDGLDETFGSPEYIRYELGYRETARELRQAKLSKDEIAEKLRPIEQQAKQLAGYVKKSPKLWYEFVLFHNDYLKDHLVVTAREVKKTNPKMKVIPCLSPCYWDAGPRYSGVDYTMLARTAEFDRIEVDPYVHIRMNREYWVSFITSLIRTAARDKPIHNWINTWDGYGTRPIDMFQGMICSFAQGVDGQVVWSYAHVGRDWAPDYRERWYYIKKAIDFIRENSDLKDYSPENQVALYVPPQNYWIKYLDAPWTKHGGVWGAGYFCERTYYSLVRAHIPTDVLIPPLGHEEMIRDDLSRYRVLILPEASWMSDVEIEMLRQWVKDGGLLVATGPLATHTKYGTKREEDGLKDVLGATFGESKARKTIQIVAEHPIISSFKKVGIKRQEHGRKDVLGEGKPRKTVQIVPQHPVIASFKKGNRINCTGLPLMEFLAMDAAKVTYIGSPEVSMERNLRYFRYKIDELKEAKAAAPSYVVDTAQVLGQWTDRTPALILNTYGKGHALACAAVDATIGYELLPRYRQKNDRVAFLHDVCNWTTDLIQSDCSSDVEINVLKKGRRTVVNFFNQGPAPVAASTFSLPLDRKPSKVTLRTAETDETSTKFKYADGILTVGVPEFLNFALCRVQ